MKMFPNTVNWNVHVPKLNILNYEKLKHESFYGKQFAFFQIN